MLDSTKNFLAKWARLAREEIFDPFVVDCLVMVNGVNNVYVDSGHCIFLPIMV